MVTIPRPPNRFCFVRIKDHQGMNQGSRIKQNQEPMTDVENKTACARLTNLAE